MKLPFKVPAGVTKFIGKTILKGRKAAPETCIITGLLCGTGALITVGIKTWKGKEQLSKDLKVIKAAKEVGTTESDIPVKDENGNDTGETTKVITIRELTNDEKKVVWAARFDFAKDICKIYWMPALLGFSSAGLIWGGRTMLRKELSAITAAYATLSESYKKYRQRIIEEFGAEKDQEIMYGVKTVDAIDSETGEASKRNIVDKNRNISQYAFYYDAGEYDSETGSWIWHNDAYRGHKYKDLEHIMQCQNWFNDILKLRGWVLYGEVANYLGQKPNPAWYNVGWVYEPGKVIELGVLPGKYQLPYNKAFCDKDDPQDTALIDPNVDGWIGYIFDSIEQYDKRCGKRNKKIRRMPTNEEMFGEEYARKLAQ